MKILKVLSFAVILAVGIAVSAGIAYASWTHVLDEDDTYVYYGGTFSSDSNCGIRGDCLYGLNVKFSSGCTGWDEPGSGCDASRTRWRNWSFWDQYCNNDGSCNNHAWNPSDAFVFITSTHATTRDAHYIGNFYFYDPNLCPNLCTVQHYHSVNQYSYSDQWVDWGDATRQFNSMYLSNANDETTNWYNVGWEAAKVEY